MNELDILRNRIVKLEEEINEENLRDVVFFDRDLITTKTQNIELTGNVQTISVNKSPDGFMKSYYRGRVILIPFYNNS